MRLQDEEPDLPPQINIVPMIDVIFAILTFFIMSSLTLSKFEGLPVNLPQATTGQLQQQGLEVLVTLRPDGQLFLNKDPVTVETLGPQILQRKGQNPEILVILNADETVAHGLVVRVMDRIRQVPGARMAIATKRP